MIRHRAIHSPMLTLCWTSHKALQMAACVTMLKTRMPLGAIHNGSQTSPTRHHLSILSCTACGLRELYDLRPVAGFLLNICKR